LDKSREPRAFFISGGNLNISYKLIVTVENNLLVFSIWIIEQRKLRRDRFTLKRDRFQLGRRMMLSNSAGVHKRKTYLAIISAFNLPLHPLR
jgi:hypothetical protein